MVTVPVTVTDDLLNTREKIFFIALKAKCAIFDEVLLIPNCYIQYQDSNVNLFRAPLHAM